MTKFSVVYTSVQFLIEHAEVLYGSADSPRPVAGGDFDEVVVISDVFAIVMVQLIFIIQEVCLNSDTDLSRLKTKPTKRLRPTKTQISLGIHPVCSESLLCTQWVAKDPSFLHADSADSDQTG